MTEMIFPPIETDPFALAQDAYDYMTSKYPDWEPSDGQLDTWMLAANARMAATLRDIAADVPISIFRYFGPLVDVPPIDEAFATALISLVLNDNTAGQTLPEGANIGIPDGFGGIMGFKTLSDTLITPGNLTPTDIVIEANEPGTAYTNLGAIGTPVTILDDFAWIDSAALQGPTGGGVDAESDDDYLNRLAENLRLMGPHPVLPYDFSVIARNIPGVYRTLALDGYNPATSTFGNERMVTIAGVDEDGIPLTAPVKAAVQAYLQAKRETTFIVNMLDPTITSIDVQFDVDAWEGALPADINANVVNAVATYLNPKTWGMPPYGENRFWYSQPVAKIDNVIGAVARVPGVKNVNTVTMRKGADPYAGADIPLAGAAALAQAGTVSGTVH